MSGVELFQRAETLYFQGKVPETFEMYQKSIKKILKDENPTATLPLPLPTDDFPRETLGVVWRNFLGFFRDPAMSFTPESHPEAHKLLNSFRPASTSASSSRIHARLERTERGKILLKGMQVTAGITLGLIAWDKRDRATAAKRYKEALDLAQTHPPFTTLAPGAVGLDKYVHSDVQTARDNLAVLVQNDIANDRLNAAAHPDSHLPQRKDVVELPVGVLRVDKTGQTSIDTSVVFATDACAKCGKRDVKLMRCSLCMKVPCTCLTCLCAPRFSQIVSRLWCRVPKGTLEVRSSSCNVQNIDRLTCLLRVHKTTTCVPKS
jgi:hypothetical protein